MFAVFFLFVHFDGPIDFYLENQRCTKQAIEFFSLSSICIIMNKKFHFNSLFNPDYFHELYEFPAFFIIIRKKIDRNIWPKIGMRP